MNSSPVLDLDEAEAVIGLNCDPSPCGHRERGRAVQVEGPVEAQRLQEPGEGLDARDEEHSRDEVGNSHSHGPDLGGEDLGLKDAEGRSHAQCVADHADCGPGDGDPI